MKAVTTILATFVMAGMSVPGLAADTPKERYGNDMTCTAVISAAVDQNALPANITTGQATSLREVYARRAQASGVDAGLQPGKVASDIDDMHRMIVSRMNAPDPAKGAWRTRRYCGHDDELFSAAGVLAVGESRNE